MLIGLGCGAATVLALRHLPGSGGDERPASGPAPARTRSRPVTEPNEPPAVEGAPDQPGPDHTFALAIAGGRVIDPESGFDEVAHLGIDGTTVAAVSREPLRAVRTVDAAGMVVAPGFIDVLSDAPVPHGVWHKLSDGVTTSLAMHGAGRSVDQYLADFPDGSVPVHHSAAFDSPFERQRLGIGAFEAATPAQLDALAAEADRALAGGFVGVDAEPEYTPGATFAELRRLGEVAQRHGLPVFFHGRYSDAIPPGTNADTLAEITRVAFETGAGVHIDHLTSTGGTFTMEASLAAIDQARTDGLDVTACAYPYDFWATTLGSTRFDDGWQERFRISHGDLAVTGTGERLTEASFERYRAEGDVLVAAFAIPEADVRAAMASPLVMIGADGLLEPGNRNHPRVSGTFARVLGRYVRDLAVVSLPDALAKMTIMPARRFEGALGAMGRKGRVQRGADADLCVLDPATIADRAVLEDPARMSVGIEWVLVAGQVVKHPDGIDRAVRPGRLLR